MSKLDQIKALGKAKAASRKSSDGGMESRHAKAGNKTGSIPVEAGYPTASRLAREEVQGAAIQPCAGVAPGPSEANSGASLQPRGEPVQMSPQPTGSPNLPKRGRPRIGEVRPKPWLTCDPPMSERTWRRRQKEGRS